MARVIELEGIGKKKKIPFLYEYDSEKVYVIPRKRYDVNREYSQSIVWWLGRFPTKFDYGVIRAFLGTKNAVPVRTGKRQHYRIFENCKGCLHIMVEKKDYGISVHSHCDIEEHGRFEFNRESMRVMSELYVWLKKNRGEVVMIPREELKFQGLLGKCMTINNGKPNRLDITKVKRYKRKPHFW